MENNSNKKNTWWQRALARALVAGHWVWQRASVALMLIALIGTFALGVRIGAGPEEAPATAEEAAKEETIYTCSMHPQIRQPDPGLCPICNMELVPVEGLGGDVGERALVMSHAARKLAEVRVSPVERKTVEVSLRMVGKVDYDETRVKTIAAWVPGRIEKLHADFTGLQVEEADPLVDIYSPQLYVAQKELLLASQQARGEEASSLHQVMLEAAREKLRLWGLTHAQIEHLEQQAQASEILTIPAPIGGTIVRKMVKEGMYVKEGTPLMTVADLSVVWVQFEAYESDLIWLREGQEVQLTTEAYPGVLHTGTIRFIDPFVNPGTRTAQVRVEVANRAGLLKPEMFAQAQVVVPVAEKAGSYLPAGEATDAQPPLVVPDTAPLLTGKRAVVYVEVPDAEEPTYEGRTIRLGPRAGAWFIVRSGLVEGERVVTHGNFKIDSALQIQAKPSMMSLPSEAPEVVIPPAFRESLGPVYDSYFALWKALKEDDLAGALAAAGQLQGSLPGVKPRLLEESPRQAWRKLAKTLADTAAQVAEAKDLDAARRPFEALSETILGVERTFGHAGKATHYEMYCPMAMENRGASWLQPDDELLNPYFGAQMLRCGEVREKFAPGTAEQEVELEPTGGDGHDHGEHQH